jgi:hypothetical protein
MQKRVIKVEYMFNSEKMSDQEYSDQDDKTFYITKEMIYDLVRKNVQIPEGFEICQDNFYINKY